MRVQLRDCNPPRGQWRHSRGRGRFLPNLDSHSRFSDRSDKLQERSNSLECHLQGGSPYNLQNQNSLRLAGREEIPAESEPLAYSEENVSKSVEESDDIDAHHPSTQSRTSSPDASLPPLHVPQSENYREWYDEPPSTALTPPPPSSFGSSASVPASILPYPIPGGYYGLPQWVHPYAPQLPYQMPYMGFPLYRPPSQQLPQTFSRPGSDINPPAATPGPWPAVGVYGVRTLDRITPLS